MQSDKTSKRWEGENLMSLQKGLVLLPLNESLYTALYLASAFWDQIPESAKDESV